MNDKRQTGLFTDKVRGEQLKLLRNVHLGPHKTAAGETVEGEKQKHLLRLIDDHDGDGQGCFASQRTLARELECSVTTVGRIVAVLVSRSFITIEVDERKGTNIHRIVWNELGLHHQKQLKRSAMMKEGGHHGDGTGSAMMTEAIHHDDSAGSVMVTETLYHGDGQNETETQPLNATTTATVANGWLLLRKRLRDLGMKAAASATDAAMKRGWSIEYVDELVREATDRKHANQEPYGVAHLCNWMTGKNGSVPPIDEADAMRIRSERLHRQRERAETIRQRIANEPKLIHATDGVKAGHVGRLLSREGLESEATDDERAAAATLDELDRQRAAKNAEANP